MSSISKIKHLPGLTLKIKFHRSPHRASSESERQAVFCTWAPQITTGTTLLKTFRKFSVLNLYFRPDEESLHDKKRHGRKRNTADEAVLRD